LRRRWNQEDAAPVDHVATVDGLAAIDYDYGPHDNCRHDHADDSRRLHRAEG
jgi:hypothetical protein